MSQYNPVSLGTLREAVKGQTPSELLLSLLGNGTPEAAPPAHLAGPAGTIHLTTRSQTTMRKVLIIAQTCALNKELLSNLR